MLGLLNIKLICSRMPSIADSLAAKKRKADALTEESGSSSIKTSNSNSNIARSFKRLRDVTSEVVGALASSDDKLAAGLVQSGYAAGRPSEIAAPSPAKRPKITLPADDRRSRAAALGFGAVAGSSKKANNQRALELMKARRRSSLHGQRKSLTASGERSDLL